MDEEDIGPGKEPICVLLIALIKLLYNSHMCTHKLVLLLDLVGETSYSYER